MYPIERTDYINAYIAAISDEMRQSRNGRRDRSGALERLYGRVSAVLSRESERADRETTPALAG